MVASQKFQIGQWVRVRAHLVKKQTNVSKGYRPFCFTVTWKRRGMKPAVGQVVGKTMRYIGRYNPGYSNHACFGEQYSKSPSFKVTAKLVVWEVKLGLMNRPIYVLGRDLEPSSAPENGLPTRYSRDPGGWRGFKAYQLREMRRKAMETVEILSVMPVEME